MEIDLIMHGSCRTGAATRLILSSRTPVAQVARSCSRPVCPAAAATGRMKTTLISFDVDGTLIRSVGHDANKLHKEAFSAAFKEVFDIDTTIDVVPHHGSTDPLILVKVLGFHGISKERAMERLSDMQNVMVDYFLKHKARAGVGLEVLPGVVDLLKMLGQQDKVAVCLVTGNLQPIGWAKMEALGIKEFFTSPFFGGFGSDYCSGNTDGMGWRDRAELVRTAARCFEQHFGVAPVHRYHIGDAPMDCQAAEAGGAVPIGVLTGIYSQEQLLAACPTATVLEQLDGRVLELCNLI